VRPCRCGRVLAASGRERGEGKANRSAEVKDESRRLSRDDVRDPGRLRRPPPQTPRRQKVPYVNRHHPGKETLYRAAEAGAGGEGDRGDQGVAVADLGGRAIHGAFLFTGRRQRAEKAAGWTRVAEAYRNRTCPKWQSCPAPICRSGVAPADHAPPRTLVAVPPAPPPGEGPGPARARRARGLRPPA
jgi:hypothetical protein